MNAYNPYAPNPYLMQAQQPDIGGLAPVFQNMAAQQANQNAALAQQNQLVNQAAQVGGSGGGGMNQLALAAMLRKKDPTKAAPVTDYSQPMPNYADPAYMQAGY